MAMMQRRPLPLALGLGLAVSFLRLPARADEAAAPPPHATSRLEVRPQRHVISLEHALAPAAGTVAARRRHYRRLRRDLADEQVQLQGMPSLTYHASLSFGPLAAGQELRVVVDTGSSNLAVAGPQLHNLVYRYYDPARSKTSQRTGDSFKVQYVRGAIKGHIYRDWVRFTDVPDVAAIAPFGALYEATDFFLGDPAEDEPFEGILGLGYSAIAEGGVTPLFAALVEASNVSDVFGLQLCDVDSPCTKRNYGSPLSQMVLGRSGAGGALAGPMRYTPILAEGYYSVQLRAIEIDGVALELSCGAFNSPGLSIVDSGTTMVLVPQAVHDAVVARIGEAVLGVLSPHAQWQLRNDTALREAFFRGDEAGCVATMPRRRPAPCVAAHRNVWRLTYVACPSTRVPRPTH